MIRGGYGAYPRNSAYWRGWYAGHAFVFSGDKEVTIVAPSTKYAKEFLRGVKDAFESLRARGFYDGVVEATP